MSFLNVNAIEDPSNPGSSLQQTLTLSNGQTVNYVTTSDRQFQTGTITEADSGQTREVFTINQGTDENGPPGVDIDETQTTTFTDPATGDNFEMNGANILVGLINNADFGDPNSSPTAIDRFFVHLDGQRINLQDLIDSGEATLTWGDPLDVVPQNQESQLRDGSVDPTDGSVTAAPGNLPTGLTISITRDFFSIGIEYDYLESNNNTSAPNAQGFVYALEVDPVPVCFEAGALIETARGPVRADDVSNGDLLLCADGAFRPVRWVSRRVEGNGSTRLEDRFRPVRIAAGALGPDLPRRDVMVSRQHRVLIRSELAETLFGANEVLVAAHKLVGLPGIDLVRDRRSVTYVHLLMDHHQIVFAEGLATETLLLGQQARKTIPEMTLQRLFRAFPELRKTDTGAVPARHIPQPREQKVLIRRHIEAPEAGISGVDMSDCVVLSPQIAKIA